MKRSRLASRLAILAAAAPTLLRPRRRPQRIDRILVAHNLLLGDTLMLTALLARLRRRYPAAAICMTVAPALLPLYAGRPYGVHPLPWDPRDARSFAALRRERGFDLALIPGDNRHALLARSLGACWIVALDGDRPDWKNRLCDELIPWPQQPTALADIFASLAGPGDECYAISDWPAPACAAFDRPPGAYAVLHVGAGSPLRLWPAERWRALAEHLNGRGIAPVFTCGPGEAPLIEAVDRRGAFLRYPGTLGLAQLWHLLAGARLLVCLDSGIAHLAKLTATPSAVLYGPGSPVLFGGGTYWRGHRSVAVWSPAVACRDQRTLFGRDVVWARRCQRTVANCTTRPRCMDNLSSSAALVAVDDLLE